MPSERGHPSFPMSYNTFMLKLLDKFLNRLTMYRLMLYFLIVLVIYSIIAASLGLLSFDPSQILQTTVLFVVFCSFFNYLISKILKIPTNFESSLITSLILTLIAGPTNFGDWKAIAFISFLAMISKFAIVLKGKHIFNPAAFAVTVSVILSQLGASWWAGNKIMLIPLVVIGLIMIYKLRWFHLIFTFLVTYLVGYSLVFLFQAGGFDQSWLIAKILVLETPLLFFSFIMLTEPLTAPTGIKKRILYGIFIAVLLIVMQTWFSQITYSLELSLLIGNILSFAMSPFGRIRLKFKEKLTQGKVSVFTFESNRKFKFNPGQFLLYTLPHSSTDQRGSRRYFSIASSPTEVDLMLVTKFFEAGSSFKHSLSQLKKDALLFATNLDGDFTIPKNSNKPLVMIAGGVGISPFRSMVKYMIDRQIKKDVQLIYSVNTEEELMFKDIFSGAEKLGLKPSYIVGEKITADLLKSRISNPAKALFYISGPPFMVRSVKSMLISELGINRFLIKSDYFPGYDAI